MTQLYKFFNSAPGDPRTYQAADFADYFGSVLSTGLLHTDNVPGMAVSVEAGTLNTIVSTGKAIMDGHLYENTASLTLTHAIPEPDLDRIDRVVLRLDLSNAERSIKLRVLTGTPSATPVAPALTRSTFIYEISLAQILVRANTVQLLAGDLVDERLDENLAGLVYSLISIPTSQFQAEWDAFMAGIQDSGFATTQSVTDLQTEVTTHKADDVSHVKYGADTGTANAKVVTLSPAPTAYVEGMAIAFKNAVLNTGAVTININGLGTKSVLKSNGNALTSGNLKVNSVYTLRYNGTSFILQGEGGEYGTAVAGDVLTGKTIGTENGIVNGTLVPGKKSASGTISYTSGPLVISGLTFRPSKVILYAESPLASGYKYQVVTVNFSKLIPHYTTPTNNTISAHDTSTATALLSNASVQNADGASITGNVLFPNKTYYYEANE